MTVSCIVGESECDFLRGDRGDGAGDSVTPEVSVADFPCGNSLPGSVGVPLTAISGFFDTEPLVGVADMTTAVDVGRSSVLVLVPAEGSATAVGMLVSDSCTSGSHIVSARRKNTPPCLLGARMGAWIRCCCCVAA